MQAGGLLSVGSLNSGQSAPRIRSKSGIGGGEGWPRSKFFGRGYYSGPLESVQICPNGSVNLARRPPCDLPLIGISGLAPAATAWLKQESTSSTSRQICIDEPPSDWGLRTPFISGASGYSSAIKRRELPIRTSARPIRPSDSAERVSSSAPNAFL